MTWPGARSYNLYVCKAAGIDLVHFVVVVALNLVIGLSTPP